MLCQFLILYTLSCTQRVCTGPGHFEAFAIAWSKNSLDISPTVNYYIIYVLKNCVKYVHIVLYHCILPAEFIFNCYSFL